MRDRTDEILSTLETEILRRQALAKIQSGPISEENKRAAENLELAREIVMRNARYTNKHI